MAVTLQDFEPAFGFGMNAVAAERSRSLFLAAENLLGKAERSLDTDEARSRALVRRALDLGYDPHEEAVPALQTATFRFFEAVADAAQSLETDDQRWLDLVEQLVESATGLVGAAVVEVLAELCDDGDLHELEPAERRRLRRLVLDARARSGRAPVEEGQVEDMVPEGEREDVVLGLLRITREYRTAAARLVG
ncbi:hypothetical protein [Aquipuribacter nitratireducens]|uniref:Uncharacterized protein n=1 Tax=Aquipuribacter nitratireducens TaxID=650104 RepID=A0ABW0GPK7_9MICO